MNNEPQPTMLAENATPELAPQVKRKGDEVAVLITQGHYHAEEAFGSMRKSIEQYWQAGGKVIELKDMLRKGRTRPIGFGAVCKACGFSDEWATQCQRIRERYPRLADIPAVENITQLKRLSGILAAKPVTDLAADLAGEKPVSQNPNLYGPNYSARPSGDGYEILDTDGQVVAWTLDRMWTLTVLLALELLESVT